MTWKIKTTDVDSVIDVNSVDEKDIPMIITENVKELGKLEKSINDAIKEAESARKSAESAAQIDAGVGHKRTAIEALQETQKTMANSQIAIVNSHTVFFEHQKKVAEILKFMFSLGCTSLAANRTVVSQLKLLMENASQDQLDDLVRKEAKNIIKQLKAQEDMMNQLNALSKTVKTNTEKYDCLFQVTEKRDEKLLKAQEDIMNQLNVLSKTAKANTEKIAQNSSANKALEKKLVKIDEKDMEYDCLLQVAEKRDRKQDMETANQIEVLQNKNQQLRHSILIAYIISIIALIMGITQILT